MSIDMLLIDQALHGYNNGHRMITSSIILSEDSSRRIAMLSDLSGAELKAGFEEYYTCYELPIDNKVVISKTWYAFEMKRPGCVWTHSLLIDASEKEKLLTNLNEIIYLFKRPSNNSNFNEYSDKIEINNLSNQKMIDLDQEKLKYILWCFLGYGDYVLVPSETSSEYTKEVLYLWCLLKEEKSVSTGSLSNRKIDKTPFNFQVVSPKITGGILHSYPEIKMSVPRQSIKNYPIWIERAIELIEHDELRDFYDFNSLFNLKYQKNKYFVDFIKLYIIANLNDHDIKVCEALNGIEKIFTQDKLTVGNAFLQSHFSGKLQKWGNGESTYEIISYLIDSSWINLPAILLEDLTKQSLINNKHGCGKIFKKILKMQLNYNAILFLKYCSIYLVVTDIKEFSEMNLEVCELLISLNPIYSESKEIWLTDKRFQATILNVLKYNKNVGMYINSIIPIILKTSVLNHINKLYEIFGEDSIQYFIKALLFEEAKNEETILSLIKICNKHSKNSIKALHILKDNLNSKQALIFTKIVDPSQLSESEIRVFISLYRIIQKDLLSEEEKKRLNVFYMTLIFRSDANLPINIVKEVSYTVHQFLLANSLDDEYWEQLKYHFPRVSVFDSWDKCKRLRKAIKRKGYHIRKFEMYKDNEEDISLL